MKNNSEVYKKTKWLRFVIVGRKPKTVVMHVMNNSDQFLGSIQWYGPWRQYTYNTNAEAHLTFNNQCLRDITDVLTELNSAYRKKV